MDEPTMKRIGRRLVRWYERNARNLPWRIEPTPYRVWVSEVMLQQTAVATVVPYFERWVRRWPGVASLARAEEREVLALWQGMGYYGRARRLHQAARLIVAEHGGELPRGTAALRRLPGVGPYVAAAICSFAFGEDEVALDANLVRVLMRLLCIEGTGAEAGVRRAAAEWARTGMPPGRSADYNQALMDFGSMVCRPRAPRCGECFLRPDCEAFRRGMQYDIPRPSPRRLKKVQTAVAVIVREGAVYLQQRGTEGLFSRMWEFPGGKVEEGETPRAALVRECREELGVECFPGRRLLSLTHYYTVFEVRLHAYLCAVPEGLPEDAAHRWMGLGEVGEYPMPSANRAVVQRLLHHDDTTSTT
jgi:A/G-specific adenine glycosylase